MTDLLKAVKAGPQSAVAGFRHGGGLIHKPYFPE